MTTRGCFYVTRSPLSSLKSARSCMPQNTSRDASVARRANARKMANRVASARRIVTLLNTAAAPGGVAAARLADSLRSEISILSAASSCVTFPIRDLTPTVHPRHAGPRAPAFHVAAATVSAAPRGSHAARCVPPTPRAAASPRRDFEKQPRAQHPAKNNNDSSRVRPSPPPHPQARDRPRRDGARVAPRRVRPARAPYLPRRRTLRRPDHRPPPHG